ncbi:ABC transporter substrate-binding protein [Goodfellowiella coeruleoviolacea]|uniref:Spermidine/putrescine transport system substrate-binding protein n=1 Tax=Goodfellowiella coeruleoviolacea TaxID=334858 RepID=A0AAE3KEA2_9PSEU|nr:ABC transporter substrate-binding protein [Goodfellowiella coeruleoviolacea]MCP2163640.1 putative spermidine/putrescine transport system substrate-binding protein [Goodfellowiella coeruleoviolacea]
MSRLLRAVLAGAVLAVSVTACAGESPSQDPNKLVVSTFGFGADRFEEAVVKPFEQQTGMDVVVESGNNADRLTKLQINKNNPTVDVVLISDLFAAIGKKQGLFEQIDSAAIPNLSKSFDFAYSTDGYGPAYTYQLLGMLYRTDKVSGQPGLSQLWDAKYKGQVALPALSASAGIPLLFGTAEQFGSGPQDVDAAFTKLTELKPNVLKFFSSSTEVVSLLDRGEVTMAPALDLFAVDPVKAGKPLAWAPMDKGKYVVTNSAQVVKGAHNKAGAEKFIDYLLSTEVQEKAAEAFNDKPVNRYAKVPDALAAVSGEIAKDPTAAGYRTPDLDFAVEHNDEWVDRFAREVSG